MENNFEKFYIIRTDYKNNDWLYAMTNTLPEALNLVDKENLQYEDTAIEFCKGSFPFDYEVYKTLFVQQEITMTMKEIKEKSGLTFSKLSWILGIPVRTLCSWCNGERECPPYIIRLIKYYLENNECMEEKKTDF